MLDLLDYRRRVTEMYRAVRAHPRSTQTWTNFCKTRDQLFATHSQTPLDEEQRKSFAGLPYYPYDPDFFVVTAVDTAIEPITYAIDLGTEGHCTLLQIGQVRFDLPVGSGTLALYWITGYGGGLFLPFRDATNRDTTYGGGRYLYDTIKGADLGTHENRITLDFNYAYHPSCAYNPKWVCPLAPRQNTLPFAIPAGEQMLAW